MLGGHCTALRVRTAGSVGGGAEKELWVRILPGQQDPPIARCGAQHPAERPAGQRHQQRRGDCFAFALRFTIGNLGLMVSASGKCLKIFG